MNFHVGQKVLYVNDRQIPSGYAYVPNVPKLGCEYTIRQIVACRALGYDEDGLRLMEVVNAPHVHQCPWGTHKSELSFRASRFRPVRSASIEAVLETRKPVKVHEPAQ
jgi:hypothetical protein